jgi:bisphosphoglycerate-independent phosphoglycerate mutase (AlkP superfamily)
MIMKLLQVENEHTEEIEAKRPPFLLCLFLDGFGIAARTEVNAVALAKMPNFAKYIREYPVALLSGETKDERRRYWSLGTGQEDDAANFLKAETCLSEIISRNGLRQLKIAASEQFSFLSLFFNNNQEHSFAGEEFICVNTPSPEEPLRPLAKAISRAITEALRKPKTDVIFASLPLAQEAATRGDFQETINNLQQIDKLLPKIITAVLNAEGLMIITAPYGNAEKTRDLASDWGDKEATDSNVPFLLIGAKYQGKTIGLADPLDGDLSVLAPAGTLANFAPTVLSLLGIKDIINLNVKSLI